MKKSSNEVASAVFNELQSKAESGAFHGIHTIRLIADGCPAQNKNTTVLSMCIAWLFRCSSNNIKCIEIMYPVTGHSFMPSNRVFGQKEKKIRKLETVVELEQYYEVFRKQRTLKLLGNDWNNAMES